MKIYPQRTKNEYYAIYYFYFISLWYYKYNYIWFNIQRIKKFF